MGEHPDVLLGSTPTDNGSIEVLVSAVDVRLAIRRKSQEDIVSSWAPDCAINLRDLLDEALEA